MKYFRTLLMLVLAVLIGLPALAIARTPKARRGTRRPPATSRTVPKVEHRARKPGEKGPVDKRVPPAVNIRKEVERKKNDRTAKARAEKKADGVDRKGLERQPPDVVVPPRPADGKLKRDARESPPRKLKRR
ncbi:MAG: hypothetical protein KC502_16070 [Myxococcales bacterium]|nr:hypothetical protein [Myxococcales bacterium]